MTSIRRRADQIQRFVFCSKLTKRDRSLDEVRNRTIRRDLSELVNQYGPIQADEAFRTVIRWQISQLGRSIKQTLNGHAMALHQSGGIVRHNGFLWPPRDDFDFKIRVHRDQENRDIEEIPLEEVAKAMALILEEGGKMTRNNLALETTRLFGYQRRGQRIQDRVGEAIDLLHSLEAIEEADRVSLNSTIDIESKLIERIYS